MTPEARERVESAGGGSLTGIVEVAVDELVSGDLTATQERVYQHKLAFIIWSRLRDCNYAMLPGDPKSLCEHAHVLNYGAPGCWTGPGPRCDIFVGRLKNARVSDGELQPPIESCVAIELKTKDGYEDRGESRLKRILEACRRLRLPIPPDETDGRDYSETEAALISLLLYQRILGIGAAYLLLVGPQAHFRLSLLAGRVRLFDHARWRGNLAQPVLFAEASQLWLNPHIESRPFESAGENT
jgi:hypothetical protein